MVKRYAPLLVGLHWLMALMIVAMLFAGHFITAATPNSSPEKIDHLKGHMAMGMAVAVFLIVRLIVRLRSDKPAPARSGMVWADQVAIWTHWGFYGLLFAQIATGLAMSIMGGLPEIVFNGHGNLPPDFWGLPTRGAHGVISKLLMAMVLLHAGAAVFHQFIKRDGLMSRMWFGVRR